MFCVASVGSARMAGGLACTTSAVDVVGLDRGVADAARRERHDRETRNRQSPAHGHRRRADHLLGMGTCCERERRR